MKHIKCPNKDNQLCILTEDIGCIVNVLNQVPEKKCQITLTDTTNTFVLKADNGSFPLTITAVYNGLGNDYDSVVFNVEWDETVLKGNVDRFDVFHITTTVVREYAYFAFAEEDRFHWLLENLEGVFYN